MPGRLLDLEDVDTRLPSRLVVDTNLVVARLLAHYYPPHIETARRTFRFFALLKTQGVIGLLPAVVCQEFFFLALRGLYRLALPSHRQALAVTRTTERRFDWDDLYKLRPDLIDQFLPDLERFRSSFETINLAVLQPKDLAPLPPGRQFEDELLRLVGRYQLNTADTALLLDAQRAGITSIATLDSDFWRTQVDFDVYTWL